MFISLQTNTKVFCLHVHICIFSCSSLSLIRVITITILSSLSLLGEYKRFTLFNHFTASSIFCFFFLFFLSLCISHSIRFSVEVFSIVWSVKRDNCYSTDDLNLFLVIFGTKSKSNSVIVNFNQIVEQVFLILNMVNFKVNLFKWLSNFLLFVVIGQRKSVAISNRSMELDLYVCIDMAVSRTPLFCEIQS